MAEEGTRSRLGRGLAALIGDVGEEGSVERPRAQRKLPTMRCGRCAQSAPVSSPPLSLKSLRLRCASAASFSDRRALAARGADG